VRFTSPRPALAAALALAVALPARPAEPPPAAARPPAPHAAKGADAAAAELAAALTRILGTSGLRRTRTGVAVVSLDSGQTLFTRDADDLFNPASNVKLFTAAAALARLGPEFRFDTEFYADPGAVDTVRALYVRGKGDPSMVTERLYAVAGELAHRGIHTVKGDLVLDDSWFDDQREGPGYDQERGDRAYLAPTGALSLNFNSVAIHVAGGGKVKARGRVELEPASDFFVVDNRTVTARARARRRVVPSSMLQGGREHITVSGRLPLGGADQVFYRKIGDPTLYFGHTLKRMLELRGIRVTGEVRAGRVPPGARLVYLERSDELAEIVRTLQKHSNNFIAEQLVKAMGAQAKGPPGSWPKGIEVVQDFLAEVGIPRGTYLMRNGSGLNDSNRFTPRQTVALLGAMWRRFPLAAEYVGALPIAGKDGTIRWRMWGTDAVGRLRAKTGTLDGVRSLSGYVETAAHEHLAFAVFANDFPGRTFAVVRGVDALGAALAAAGRPAELGAAVALAEGPAAPVETADAEARARVARYQQLGREGDSRNLAELRTALVGERDPALRLAAAEAVYRSDPDSDPARRAFLDAVITDAPQAFARLRALSAPEGPTPMLGALADLAAEGEAEPMERLLALAPAAAADRTLADPYADALAEVGRTAPDELLGALLAAGPAVAEASLSALARGLGREADEEHPFPAVLRRALADPDQARAARAQALSARLGERMSVEAAPAMAPAPAGTSARPVPIPAAAAR
jgi:D-alanyl-D-alanine carboxypeptidase/D-alanyl-D-alanine-endopeptidase (penicillin-binding protein 4)